MKPTKKSIIDDYSILGCFSRIRSKVRNRKYMINFVKLSLIYLLTLVLLIGLSVALFFLLGVIYLDRDLPVRLGNASVLKLQPSLSIVPRIDSLSSLIRYRIGWYSSYGLHMNNLYAFVQNYEDYAQNSFQYDCENPSDFEKDPRYSCRFPPNIGSVGCNIGTGFGYDEAYPCMAVRLNKVIGWVPKLTRYANTTYRIGHPTIKIKCDGVNDADKDLVRGKICYYDEEAKYRLNNDLSDDEEGGCSLNYGQIRNYYFPYKKQDSYESPFVWVKFLGIKRHIVVMLECWAEAENLNREDNKVQFELLID